MSLADKVMESLKEAMKAKDEARKRTLRSIKSEILLLQTDGSGEAITEEKEIKLLQRMVKQREESANMYQQNGMPEKAAPELEEMAILREFLPKPFTPEELEVILGGIIAEVGATSAKDMGKVMALANQRAQGRAEGKVISEMVKKLLS